MTSCPICSIELNRTHLDSGLPAFTCPSCHGIWISAVEYQDWLTIDRLYPLADIDIEREFDTPFPISDSNRALICPDCGHILRRYQIWPNLDFNLDRCSHCYSIWFDNNEWQTLQAQELHKQVFVFFTQPWQEKLRGQEMKAHFETMYLSLFGPEDYEKIKAIRQWVHDNPNGHRLVAYLIDRDPYKG
jgi:Zn-finger nucleic acid-binding protein